MSTNQTDPNQSSFFKSFVARIINGAIAGVVGTSVIFPLDLAKTRLQEQTKIAKSTPDSIAYKNVFDCLAKVARNEGLRNLYKGLGVNLLFVMPEKALKLSVNDQLRSSFGSVKYLNFSAFTIISGSILPIYKEVIAGASAGFAQVIVTTPMEFLKIQMQMANKYSNGKSDTSAFKLATNLIKKDGIGSIYRGLTATLLRDVTFSLFYFPSFAMINRYGYSESGQKPAFYFTLMSGMIAGSLSAFIVTPFDVIKTRLQFIDQATGRSKYNGITDCTVKTFKNDGPRAFFRGSVPRMIVIAPLFGIAQMVYFFGVAEIMMNKIL